MNRRITSIISPIAIILVIYFIYSLVPKPVHAPAPKTTTPIGTGATSTQATDIPKKITVSDVAIDETLPGKPTIHIRYPTFPSLDGRLDTAIASSVSSRISDFRGEVTENQSAREATSDPAAQLPPSSYSFDARYQVVRADSNYVSLIIRYSSYVGGANESQDTETFNYDVRAGKMLALIDLFPHIRSVYLSAIADRVRTALSQTLADESPGYEGDDMLFAGTEPTEENFSRFTFTDDTITFYFPKYQVAPGAFGEQRTTLVRDEIR